MQWSVEHDLVVRRVGHGPEVVWLHGLGEWSVSFDAIARHPGLAGFTHVLPDLPGYGRSAWPAPATGDSLERHAAHLAAWLAERAPAILVGHSMGGVLATLCAERTKVRAIVDVDGNLSRGDCTFSATAAGYALDDFLAQGFAAMRTAVYERGLSDPALRGYHAGLLAASPVVFHANAVDLVALSTTETLAARLAATAIPTLFVAGVPGGICARSRELLDQHGVRWIGIEPSGHWPFLDQPDAFATAVGAFLRDLA